MTTIIRCASQALASSVCPLVLVIGSVRAGDTIASSDIGNEIDLTFSYKFTTRLTGSLGYSHFFAGDFLADTGLDDDIDFAYAQVLFNF